MKKYLLLIAVLAIVGFGCEQKADVDSDFIDELITVDESSSEIVDLGFTVDGLGWGEFVQDSVGCPSSWIFTENENVKFYTSKSNCKSYRGAFEGDVNGYIQEADGYVLKTPYFEEDINDDLVISEYDVVNGQVLVIKGEVSTGPSIIPTEGKYAVILNTQEGDIAGGVFVIGGDSAFEDIEDLVAHIAYKNITSSVVGDEAIYAMSSGSLMFTAPSRFSVSQGDAGGASAVAIYSQDGGEKIVVFIEMPFIWDASNEAIGYQDWLDSRDLGIYEVSEQVNIGGFDLDMFYPLQVGSEFYQSYTDPTVYTGVIDEAENKMTRIIVDSPVSDDMQKIIDSIIFMPTEEQLEGTVIIP